jgi:hypothetical protein
MKRVEWGNLEKLELVVGVRLEGKQSVREKFVEL